MIIMIKKVCESHQCTKKERFFKSIRYTRQAQLIDCSSNGIGKAEKNKCIQNNLK
jgi:hypothetical protein